MLIHVLVAYGGSVSQESVVAIRVCKSKEKCDKIEKELLKENYVNWVDIVTVDFCDED